MAEWNKKFFSLSETTLSHVMQKSQSFLAVVFSYINAWLLAKGKQHDRKDEEQDGGGGIK